MLFENVELMNPDLVLEVPDTPDRVAKLNNGQLQNSVHDKISTMEDKKLLFHQGRGKAEGAVSRQWESSGYNAEELFHQANEARLLSEPFDSKSSPDIERHGPNGVSTKNKESMERNNPLIVSYPKNCRDYRRKLVNETKSGDSELLRDQRNKKFLGVGSCLPPIRHPRSQCGMTVSQEEKDILSEAGRSVSRPRNEGKRVCLSGGSHSKSEQETSTRLSVDKPSSPLGVKKLVRNGCISPCNTTKRSGLLSKVHSQCGLTSSKDDKSYVAGRLGILEAVTKDDVNLLPKRMQSEMHKMTSDISSRNKGKALADDHVEATGQIGKSSSSRPIRRHGLEMNITNDADDIILDSEDLVRAESDKPTDNTHRAFSSKGANISMGDESTSRQLKNSSEVDIRYNDCSTIVLDSPESARYPEGTRQRSTRGKRKYTPNIDSGECSSSAPDDFEVSYLGTSVQSSSSRLPRAYNTRSRLNVLKPVVEVDEILSPELMRNDVRERSLRVPAHSSAVNMQLESDELLARQLQEQLYNESPTIATRIDEEIDAALAMSLQQEEHTHSATSTSRQTNRAHRSRLPARASQRLPSRSTMPSSGINRVRSMNSTTRLAQFLRDIDLRGMDFESRLNFFEQLEVEYDNHNDTDFSHIQMRRDFTENDYEALLALDDNNHRHTGASRNQINSLPQSIVQTDNVDEPCAVCLENPSVGDTIRHLPCFHKFHKDCIDEWLRRKTSCPVCKISVT